MATIRRLKATVAPDGTPIPAAIHFAVEVAPAGNVTKWTEKEAEATDFHPGVARKVADFYEGRANTGELKFSDKVGGASHAEVDEAAIAHAERLGEENEELRRANEKGRADLAIIQKHFDADVKTLREENTQLRTELSQWEQNYNALEKEYALASKELTAANDLLKG